jgi:ethanolamine utilization protein EutP (predicted NTPase)
MPNFILTGHVDHGKSTLCGRLLVNYTEQDSHYLDKLRQTSPNNWLGQIFDIYDEERERNKTFEWSKIEVQPIVLFDTPGHKTFIREFLQALTIEKITACILCISGKPDEFESGFRLGDVKEYLKLIRAAGLGNILIVWTKDIPTDKDKNELNRFINQLGFKNESFNVDSVNNIGVTELWNYLKDFPELKQEEEILIEKDKCIGELRFFDNDKLYCLGYKGIAHSGGEEANFELKRLRIDSRESKFIQTSKHNRADCVITFDKPIKVGKRIILRDASNSTIGFIVRKMSSN